MLYDALMTGVAPWRIAVKPEDEWQWVRRARSVFVWALGQWQYKRLRDHLREQFVLAFWMLCWLAMLRAIDLLVSKHTLLGSNINMSEALHALEDISLLVWFGTFIAKAVRKEWRDYHD